VALLRGVCEGNIAHLYAHAIFSLELDGLRLIGDVRWNRQREHRGTNRRHVPVDLMFDMTDMPDALADFGGVHQERHEDTVGPVSSPNQPSTIAERAQKDQPVGISAPGDLSDEPEPEFALFPQDLLKRPILVGDLLTLFCTRFDTLDVLPAFMLPAVDAPEFFIARCAVFGKAAVEIHQPGQLARENEGHKQAAGRYAEPQERQCHGKRDNRARALEHEHILELLDASLVPLDVCCVQIGAFLQVLAHALLKEQLIHAALELREIRALRVLSRDHLQAVEIAVYDHECSHAEEAHLDGVCVVPNESVDQIFRQPSDAVQGGDGNGKRHKHPLGPTTAFGSDKFVVMPATHPPALLHFVEVFAPGSGDFARILRIDNHKTTPGAGSPTAKRPLSLAVGLQNVLRLNCTAWSEPLDETILRRCLICPPKKCAFAKGGSDSEND